MLFFYKFGLAFLCMSFVLPTQAYVYQHPKAREVSDQIKSATYSTRVGQKLSLKMVSNIDSNYLNLARHEITVDDLLELKFELLRWHQDAMAFIARKYETAQTSKTKKQLLEIRDRLRTLSTTQQAERMELNTLFGFGPQRFLKIKPGTMSPWPYSRWQNITEFSKYIYKGDNVFYRNTLFKTGDIILNSETSDSDGVFTSITVPRPVFSHSGMVVIFHENGKKLPAVVEAHEKGVRAVPLNVYLHPAMTAYAEVYRLKNQPVNWAVSIEIEAKKLISEVHPYNLTGEDNRRDALTCRTVITTLLERTGISPLMPTSRISAKAFDRNIQNLGFRKTEFATPTDIVRNKRARIVGYFDNGQFKQMVARELVSRRLAHFIENSEIDIENLPLGTQFKQGIIEKIRDPDSFLGRTIRPLIGFELNNFPMGTGVLLAVSSSISEIVEHATQRCHTTQSTMRRSPPNKIARYVKPRKTRCYRYIDKKAWSLDPLESFSIHDLGNDLKMTELLDHELEGLHNFVQK